MKAAPLPPLPNGATYCDGPDGRRICTGSQMGRSNVLPEPGQRATPCRLRLVNMREADRTGYDAGGAYWGGYFPRDFNAGRMFRAVGECGGMIAQVFTRAKNREQAKADVRAILPNARFFR